MSETDSFSDSVFAGRLQKFLPMLGSEQSGEADAARRKLIEHLGQHRLSLLDLATRLREQPRGGFLQGAHETQLERQLVAAKEARQDASNEALHATMRMRAMELELRQANQELSRLVQSQTGVRVWASVATVACAGLLLAASVPFLTHGWPSHPARDRSPSYATRNLSGPVDHSMISPVPPQPSQDAVGNGALRVGVSEQSGTAAVQDCRGGSAPTMTQQSARSSTAASRWPFRQPNVLATKLGCSSAHLPWPAGLCRGMC